MSIQVEVKGLDKLVAKLGHVQDPLKPLFEKAAKFAHGRVKVYAKPHAADKGTLANAMKYELLGGAGTSLSARVFPATPIVGIANTVEAGRKPGKQPSYQRLMQFVQSNGVKMGNAKTVKETAYLLALWIKAHGTKGVRFMEHAAKDTDKEMPKLVNEAKKQIEADWSKP
jgi:hypothetical protein